MTFQLSQGHRIVVLASMEAVLKDSGGDIDADLAKDVTRTAVQELVAAKVSVR